GAGNVLNLSNSIFENNGDLISNTAKGGAVEWAGGGFLNINNCTFNNNTAGSTATNRGAGGAVDYNLLNLAGASGQGGLTITNSTFTNNIAYLSGGSGAGGAVNVTIGTTQTPRNVTITNNTFTGNQAAAPVNGLGGAVKSFSPGAITFKFNRIVGNTATSGIGTGLYLSPGGTNGAADATQNWWGCNAGPGNAGCDSADGDTANITTNPRIVLAHTPTTNPIQLGQSTGLTASFLRDSANNVLTLANISRLIGLPISFSGVRGTISGAQATIQANGTATATFNSNAAGAGIANAIVDNEASAASITITKLDTSISMNSDTPDPTLVGQPYTVIFNAVQSVPPTVGVPTPTGSVTVSDGTNSCTATLPATSCTLTSFTTGNKNLTATYNGDSNYNPSPVSASIQHNVLKADTSVSVSSLVPTTVFGQNYAVTANVSVDSPGSGTPTGTITVTDGTNNCTINLPATSCNLPSNYIGSRNISATYNGDLNYNPSPASAPISHTVNQANTVTAITADTPDPSNIGQNVTISFSVTAASPGGGTPTGNVTVTDGTNSCTANVATGQCVLSFSTSGSFSLTAFYEGDTNFIASSSAVETHSVCGVLLSYQVTNNADSGSGSLRQTISGACAGSLITFAPTVTGTINVGSAMTIARNLEIQGPGASELTLAGNSLNGVFGISNGATVRIAGLTVSNSVLKTGNGGAISNSGNLTLSSVHVKDSLADGSGGAIFNDGVLLIEKSTISNSTSTSNGGGIESGGNFSTILTVVNSTISGNTTSNFGGGIDASSGTINLINSTITNNRADFDNNSFGSGGGIYTNASATFPANLRNNIIAGNFNRSAGGSPTASDIGGNNVTTAFYNIIGNAATSGGITHGLNGNQVGNSGAGTISISSVIDTALTNNGGGTPTHRITTTSPAADKGSAANTPFAENLLAPVTTDQRGVFRPYDNPAIANAVGGDGSDIGAFEIASPTAANVSVSGRISTANGNGISRAKIVLTLPNGETRIAISNSFGFYRFVEIPVGETCVIAVESKKYVFNAQVLNISESIENLNLTALNEN
ncbi:MAG TPA: Ig-like domain-containing protein, partial [Pyrinomonadaceae bacterium]|nr:Ig-like domain-containing protein [Pyrinomonadaceae bacterium]